MIALLVEDCRGHPLHDPRYLGYFKCFNLQLYYEAHDVLEELWLGDKYGPTGNFYKGLIQFAGAFVHLQKNRLGPASKLFRLTLGNLKQYPSNYLDLEVNNVCALAETWELDLVNSTFTTNPWSPQTAPRLNLMGM